MSMYAKYRDEWIEKYNSGMSFRAIGLQFDVSKATVQNVIKDYIEKRPRSQTKQFAEKWKVLYENEAWSVSDIANKYGFSVSVVSKRLKELGVEIISNHSGSSQFEQYVSEWLKLYEAGSSLRRIAEQYQCSVQTVSNHLTKEMELRSYAESSRKYEVDEYFFQEIDSKEKAYWLGYLFANGSTLEHLQSYSVSLAASQKQMDRLEGFLKALSTERPILKHKGEDVYSVRIHSERLFKDVRCLGLINNKKSELEFPPIDRTFMKSFLLGYMDGKGYISTNRYHFSLTGSEKFLNQFICFVKDELSFEWNYSEKQHNHYQVQVWTKNEVISFLDWLYEEQTEFDERKHHTYLSMRNPSKLKSGNQI